MPGYRESVSARFGPETSLRLRTAWWCTSLAGILAVATVFAASVGSVDVGFTAVAAVLVDAVTGRISSFGLPETNLHAGPEHHETIVVNIRAPRVAVAAVVGFALGGAGAVMQGFFRNPMADPTIIGISSGAAVGAVAVIVFSLSVNLHLAAFAGALAAAFVVYALATKNGRTGVATLLLAGVAVQMFLGAVVSLMIYASDDQGMRQAVYWMMGNMAHREWWHVTSSTPIVLVGFGVLLLYARDLNVLVTGEEAAQTLGVEVQRTKLVLLTVSTLITAAAVAVAGVIGFVGLVVPHAMRLLVGPDHRILLPTSALAGACFLVLADSSARYLLSGGELPVGIVTALLGVPFFLYLLRQREVHEL